MQTSQQKSFCYVWYALLLLTLTGCLTKPLLEKAGGYTRERAMLERGDQIFKHGEIYYAQKPKQGIDVSKLPIPKNPPGVVFVYDPHHAYYLLLPFSIAGDVVILPFQIVAAVVMMAAYGPAQ